MLLSALSIAACRKDLDTTAPKVTILLPGAGTTLSIPDTLTVRVRVEDDSGLKSVWMALTDVNGVPVAPAVLVPVDGSSAMIERDISVLDERITSGMYTLTVRADDETNTGSAFRPVNVQAAPLRLRAVYLTTPFGGTPATITRIDSLGGQSTFLTMADVNGGTAVGRTRHVVLAGGQSAPLLGVPTWSGAGNWQVANQNALAQPFFRHLRLDPTDGRVYFGTNDGFIRGFMGSGSQTFTAQTQAGFLSIATAVVGDRLMVAEQAISLPERRMVSYTYTSGIPLAWHPLDLDVRHLDKRSSSTALVFGDRAGEGVIQERDVMQGGVFEMRVFSEGGIRSVARLNGDAWAVALPDKIVRFHYPTNTVVTLAQGISATWLAYEEATGRIYAAQDATVHLIDPGTGQQVGTISAPHPIGAVLPLLNR